MERLSGLDAGFLYMETPTLHMHTLKISIVDLDTGQLTVTTADQAHLSRHFKNAFGLSPGRWRALQSAG